MHTDGGARSHWVRTLRNHFQPALVEKWVGSVEASQQNGDKSRVASDLRCCPVADTVYESCAAATKPPNETGTMNMLQAKGRWSIIKGKLKQKWSKLTDDDLQYVEGKEDELIGRIQKRTGETRENIERTLNDT
jgi:uncharacterized protein YjbJ (UPF0337 family)